MSGRNDWGTPRKYFDLVEHIFGPMDVDVCAHADNTKVPSMYFTERVNGLIQDWTRFSRLWMNPPYSLPPAEGKKKGEPVIQDWLQKAYQSTRQANVTVFALVPNDPSTKWWCNWVCNNAQHVLFNCGTRLKFDDQKGSPTFTTALAIYSFHPITAFRRLGIRVDNMEPLPKMAYLDVKKGIII